MKKVFVVSVFIFFAGFIPHVFAGGATGTGFVALAPIPGLTQGATTDPAGLANFFNNLYKYLIGIAAILAVIEIIWGGLEISTQDSVSKHSDGKERITQAILGLILVLSPVLVFSIINPSILNLSLNLPPIQPPQGAPAGMGGGAVGNTPPPTSGCTTTHTGPYLETAVCASQSYATSYRCQNGLTLQVQPCRVTDAASGRCLDTSATAYCAGKTATVQVYQYYNYHYLLTGPLAFVTGNATWVPRDAAAANAFQSGCQNDGGIFSSPLTAAAFAFINSHLFQVSNGCSSSYGTIPVPSSYSGVVCFGNSLSCNAPN